MIWGFGEATLFFIVPDVWLTFVISKYGFKPAFKNILLAVLGATIGGVIMYFTGRHLPEKSLLLLDYVPGISVKLLETVGTEIKTYNILAMFIAPLKGIPYKIYATTWGIINGNMLILIIASVFARGLRFLATAALAGKVLPLINKGKNSTLILFSFWLAFYLFYFSCFGW